MKAQCILQASDIVLGFTELILFPEGVPANELTSAGQRFPDALMGGAVEEAGMSRGLLLQSGKTIIDYYKVESDGRTKGSGNRQQLPVCEYQDYCIGVLVCLDIQYPFGVQIVEAIRRSSRPRKILCIPADMRGPGWFQEDEMIDWSGMNVMLCNNAQVQVRCRSFISDEHGKKRVKQRGNEPIFADLSCL